MTAIPSQNIFSSNAATNLDIAAKFLIAAALPSAEIPVKLPAIPTRVLPITGVSLPLQSFFKYKSTASTANFSLLVPFNSRLAAMLDSEMQAIESLPKLTSVIFAGTATGVAAPILAGVANLEQLIYALAITFSEGVLIETEIIAGQVYRKITGNYSKNSSQSMPT